MATRTKKQKQNDKQNEYKQQEELIGEAPASWINARRTGCCEKCEIHFYRFLTYVPVIISFSLFFFLFTFYIFCYIHPCLVGDFYGTLGIQDFWLNSSERENDKLMAEIYLGIFAFCVLNLLVAMLLTIFTDPGHIPQDLEWDMQDDLYDIKEKTQFEDQRTQDDFVNQEISEDVANPREPSHFDYRFIKSKAGPIYQNEYGEFDEAKLINGNNLNNKLIPTSFERKNKGGVRMCQRCLRTKPDRTHHCSQCNKCILKMDHHCPWVANCIGFYNYKYFLNMLFYASVTSFMMVVTAYPVFLAVLASENINTSLAYYIVTAWILALVFCFIIVAFYCFHLYLLSNQYTTIEYCEKRSSDKKFKQMSPYDRGCCTNFSTVLGDNFLLWCFPCNRNLEGEGLHFEVRDDLKPKSQAPDSLIEGDRQSEGGALNGPESDDQYRSADSPDPKRSNRSSK